MRVLLDTHLLLWSVASSRRLPKGARSLILEALFQHDLAGLRKAGCWPG